MHQLSRSWHPNMKNLGEIAIRVATDEDTAGILGCLASAFEPFRRHYSPEAFLDTVLNAEMLQRRMREMHVLIAISGDRIVGTVAGIVKQQEGHLRGMAVVRESHGTGVALELLDRIESWLKEQRCKRISLDTTLPLTRAMRFYEKNGYKKSGRVFDFFGMPLIEYEKELI
jgi:GNAT superfamily N-acetyltransferase